MVEIVTFDPDKHAAAWQQFIVTAYRNPNYVLLSPAYLRWQFLDNSANRTGGYTLWLVTHRDEVVAQLGFVPFVGRTPAGARFAGVYPINLMVLPAYRVAGLGAILLKRLLSENPCVLNPGSSDAGADLCTGLGMRDLGLLNRYVAILDLAAARRLAAEQRLPAGVAAVAPAGMEPGLDRLQLTRRLPDDTPRDYPLPVAAYGAARNRAYLQWRYQAHPGLGYEFLLTPDGANLLVFHEEREPQGGALVLRIVELLALGEAQDLLLEGVLQAARARGAVLVDFYCSLPCYDAVLRRAGFFVEAEHPDGRIAALFQPLDFRKLGIRTLIGARLDQDAPAAPWFITKGDSDQDRPNDRRAIPQVEAPPRIR